jgi:hypothetical protein
MEGGDALDDVLTAMEVGDIMGLWLRQGVSPSLLVYPTTFSLMGSYEGHDEDNVRLIPVGYSTSRSFPRKYIDTAYRCQLSEHHSSPRPSI